MFHHLLGRIPSADLIIYKSLVGLLNFPHGLTLVNIYYYYSYCNDTWEIYSCKILRYFTGMESVGI